ncbi:hypothetical protein [Paludibaculum fermentans]|uniref:hypothetical protein n=1 Tax=Paludibaculum fermentans TaxID=1473598 RepID=UPI003EBCB4ED
MKTILGLLVFSPLGGMVALAAMSTATVDTFVDPSWGSTCAPGTSVGTTSASWAMPPCDVRPDVIGSDSYAWGYAMVSTVPFRTTIGVGGGGTHSVDAYAYTDWADVIDISGLDPTRTYIFNLDLAIVVFGFNGVPINDEVQGFGSVDFPGGSELIGGPSPSSKKVNIGTITLTGVTGFQFPVFLTASSEVHPVTPVGGGIYATYTFERSLGVVPEPQTGLICGGGLLLLTFLKLRSSMQHTPD